MFAPIGVELKLTDDEGARLPHDGTTFGRLKVRGSFVVREYYKGGRNSNRLISRLFRANADGIFNGVLCNDPARCDSSKASTGIAASNLIIMSGSTPDNLVPAPGSTLSGASIGNGSVTYLFTVADRNNNPMPNGTIVKATVIGTGLTLSYPTSGSYTYPCTTEPVTYAFTVAVGSTAVNGAHGTLLLDVITGGDPTQKIGGVDTTASYSIPVVP